ncbi:MAG TPA: hypothetical protein VFL76_04900 [Edaphocola sp.]|nr:hypothetical protein [Edaphocola sp.]
MGKAILFHEKQHFRQWWLWLLLIIFPAYSIYAGWQQFADAGSIGEALLINGGELLVLGAIITLMLTINLETSIREDGIDVRLFPFHIKFRHFEWHTLRKVYVRQYAPLKEYGGWGLRWGLFGSGTAYNISGNTGIQLVFMDGGKLLIGTRKPDECKAALQQIGHYRP